MIDVHQPAWYPVYIIYIIGNVHKSTKIHSSVDGDTNANYTSIFVDILDQLKN